MQSLKSRTCYVDQAILELTMLRLKVCTTKPSFSTYSTLKDYITKLDYLISMIQTLKTSVYQKSLQIFSDSSEYLWFLWMTFCKWFHPIFKRTSNSKGYNHRFIYLIYKTVINQIHMFHEYNWNMTKSKAAYIIVALQIQASNALLKQPLFLCVWELNSGPPEH